MSTTQDLNTVLVWNSLLLCVDGDVEPHSC